MAGRAAPEPVTRFRRDMSMMGFIAYLILGLIAGAIAKAILPGKQGGGIFATLIIGVIGAMLGGWLGGAIFNAEMNEFFSLSTRSEEHTSELQSRGHLVCRLLPENNTQQTA